MNNKTLSKQKGFTLIELMVAVTLFAIVMVISMGAILTVVNGNKKNQTMQIAINNLNYAVESMTRAIKTGYNYNVDTSCESVTLNVTDDQNGDGEDDIVTYSIREFDDSTNLGLYIDTTDSFGTDIYNGFITAPDINITELCFRNTDSGFQPAITIVIQGETTSSKEELKTTFNIFTSVTQRQVQYD